MKKLIAITLCFVLTAAALTACRSKDPEETNSPTQSTTVPATQPTVPTTMPTILPDPMPTDDTTGTMDATGGTDFGAPRQSGRPMPMR